MQLSKTFTMESAHLLPKHEGKCRFLHGHSWLVTVTVEGAVDPETGFVLDYAILKRVFSPLVEFLDHKFLNAYIAYPTSESLCLLFASLGSRLVLPGGAITRFAVTVNETCTSSCTWDSNSKTDMTQLRGLQALYYGAGPGVLSDPLGDYTLNGNKADYDAAYRASAVAVNDIRTSLVKSLAAPGVVRNG